jgi:hypothetical protein
VVVCFGILHRVENPLGLLRGLAGVLAPAGRVLEETLGVAGDGRIELYEPGEVYRRDDYVRWGFGAEGLTALAAHASFARVMIDATPTIDGPPRILATLQRPGD